MRQWLVAAAIGLLAPCALGDEVSLRLGGKEVELTPALSQRLAALAREALRSCGPNTRQHASNFGLAAFGVEERWKRLLEGSRLRVAFREPFARDFTRHGASIAEHLQCGYLPSLELACLAELAPHLPARYRETCARLERDAHGRIVMPPPDIAPSCS